MEQKIIWMLLLIIGILSNLLSCEGGSIDKGHFVDYTFINNSDYNLSIEVFNNRYTEKNDPTILKSDYNVLKDNILSQKIELTFGSTTGIIALSDSVSIKFENERRVSFLPSSASTSRFNILGHRNYNFNKKSENHDEYTYTFTEQNYKNAEPCE